MAKSLQRNTKGTVFLPSLAWAFRPLVPYDWSTMLSQSLKGLALVVALAISFMLSPVQQARAGEGDNYPWPTDSTFPSCQGVGPFDEWGYCKRYCTSWVAWALHDRNGFELPRGLGDASTWKDRAASLGFTANNTPALGAVAWWSSNHVAWVKAISSDGKKITIEEYNNPAGSGIYGTRSVMSNNPDSYIHFKDLPSGGSPPGQPADPNHDGVADVVVVPFVGTGSGNTEAHALNGGGYGSWLFNLATAETAKPARNGYHLFADLNGDHTDDMYEVSMDAGSTVDVHVKAGPNFTTSLGDWATPIRGQSPTTAKVALADVNNDGKPDLYVFTLRASNMVDVHILDGRNFTQSLGDFATPAGVTAMNDYEILANDYNRDGTPDMYLVSLRGDGARTYVHVLDGRGFQTWLGHWRTPFAACDITHTRVLSGDKNSDGQPDLYFTVHNNGAGKIDVLVLDGRNFNNWVGMWTTIAGATSFAVADIALAG